MITFEVCECDATHKHGYFHVDGNRMAPTIYSTPMGQKVLADIAAEKGLSEENVASTKTQLESAGLSPEILDHEEQMAAMPPELLELMAFLQQIGGRVVVVR